MKKIVVVLFCFVLANLCPAQSDSQSIASKPLFSNIKFEITRNLIFVQTRSNDSEPLWFILDSGASTSVINEKLARSLGFKFGKKNKINAIGGKIEYSLVKNIDLNVSGATLSKQTLAAIDLSVLEPKFGRSINGILGSEFFKRFVVKIDYANQSLDLYEPADFRYDGNGEVIEFELESNTPFIRVRLSPKDSEFVEGKFLVDTGAISTLYINKQFAETHGLQQSLEKTIPDLFTTQLGGEVDGRIGRMRKTAVANFLFENMIAHFPEEKSGNGSLTSSTNDGIIGGGIFRRFTVILDYSRRHLILEPNKNFSEPFKYDQSGLELIADGADFKTIKVKKILENSPASEAGLRDGDMIVSIGGKAANEMSLDQIAKMLSQSEQEYGLTILRDSKIIKTDIKLRRLI